MVGLTNSDAEVVTTELSVEVEVPPAPQSNGKDSPNIEPSTSVL